MTDENIIIVCSVIALLHIVKCCVLRAMMSEKRKGEKK